MTGPIGGFGGAGGFNSPKARIRWANATGAASPHWIASSARPTAKSGKSRNTRSMKLRTSWDAASSPPPPPPAAELLELFCPPEEETVPCCVVVAVLPNEAPGTFTSGTPVSSVASRMALPVAATVVPPVPGPVPASEAAPVEPGGPLNAVELPVLFGPFGPFVMIDTAAEGTSTRKLVTPSCNKLVYNTSCSPMESRTTAPPRAVGGTLPTSSLNVPVSPATTISSTFPPTET